MKKSNSSQSWEELTFANNFLFCKIMESDPELCRQLLELLLHIKIDHLEVPEAERTMQEWIDSKSVRFDVYAKDNKRIFDIEIQTTNNKNLPKRARYYQSIIDVDNLSKGDNYTKLKDTYIIFLCLEKPFDKDLPVYFFENICRQDKGIKLNDRTFKVFFNAGCCDKMKTDEEKSFFKFLKGEQADSDFTRNIEEKVAWAKANKEWRRQYMTWQQTIDEEKEIAREEGFADGAQQTAIANARNLLQEGDSPEKVARCCSLPLKQVLALKEELHQA
ncbi:MAG: Rpn family recombination-promoting nuclease/putative transposase [Treponema sp.]|nr:Rpn family recombination-promoting nuclease/putative transposase [Treponema sp.]